MALVQPSRTRTPSSAKCAMKEARMPSFTDWAANSVSAAASEGVVAVSTLATGAGGWAQPARPRATRRGIATRMAAILLEHVTGEVFVRREVGEPRVDVRAVDGHAPLAPAGIERHVLEELLHHRVQAPRADVLGALVHRVRDLGDAAHAFGRECELDT